LAPASRFGHRRVAGAIEVHQPHHGIGVGVGQRRGRPGRRRRRAAQHEGRLLGHGDGEFLAPLTLACGRPDSAALSQPEARALGALAPVSKTFWASKWRPLAIGRTSGVDDGELFGGVQLGKGRHGWMQAEKAIELQRGSLAAGAQRQTPARRVMRGVAQWGGDGEPSSRRAKG
jgi:hypothetical protein